MIVEYHIDLDDYEAFIRNYVRTSPAMARLEWWLCALFIGAGPVLALLGMAAILTAPEPDYDELLALAIVFFVMPLICWPLSYWIVTPLHRRFQPWLTRWFIAVIGTHGILGQIKLDLQEDTLTEITSSVATCVPWSKMLRIEEEADHLFVYFTSQSGAIIPKRGFLREQDYQATVAYIRRHFPHVKGNAG
jgi:hypothetical protein